MGCAHDSIKTAIEHELIREDVDNPFFRVVKIEDICQTCSRVVFLVMGRKNCIDYFERRIKELESD